MGGDAVVVASAKQTRNTPLQSPCTMNAVPLLAHRARDLSFQGNTSNGTRAVVRVIYSDSGALQDCVPSANVCNRTG